MKYFIIAIFISIVVLDIQAQSKEQVETILEQFCIEHFDSCFSKRHYISNSLCVDTIMPHRKDGLIEVMGHHSYYHSYLGSFRNCHTDVVYKASISLSEHKAKILFRKGFIDMRTWADCEVCEHTIILKRSDE